MDVKFLVSSVFTVMTVALDFHFNGSLIGNSLAVAASVAIVNKDSARDTPANRRGMYFDFMMIWSLRERNGFLYYR